MGLEEGWDDAMVESAILSCLELHLIDVAKLVSNGRWRVNRALGETLDKGDHLGSKCLQQSSVGQVEQAA